MDTAKQYDEKVSRIMTSANMGSPDRMPVITLAQTWSMDYAGTNAADTFTSVDREFEVYAKFLKESDFDGTLQFGNIRPIKLYESLGYSPFFFSPDGVTIQHQDNCILPTEEIKEYIADPIKYLRNKALYRRFPALQKDFPDDLSALGNALQEMFKHQQKLQSMDTYLREHVGTPKVTGDLFEPALDRYICYRSFAEGMKDLRKRPELVLEALEATYPMLAPPPMPMQQFPFAFSPIVTVTYLSRKNFEKFFWPTAKRLFDTLIGLGAKVCIAMEGTWEHVYDFLLEFPKGSIVAFVEGDDMIKTKKIIGDKVCIIGGMDDQLLSNGTKQQCIDYTKNVIDGCGTEGVMITHGKCLLSPGQINVDNYRAVVDFVHEYTS